MAIKAIETKYKGYRFRSRLEARWAVFFDALGLEWEYEAEGFEFNGVRYLPDFKVHYPGRDDRERHVEWFEVKPKGPMTDEDFAKVRLFAIHIDRITILDGPPTRGMYVALGPDDDFWVRRIEIERYEPETRPGYCLYSSKGRMWWDSDYETADFDEIISPAVEAARSARFEFGESG